MAAFNGGRMIALFLGVLFALNVSFAQDPQDQDSWETVVFYMVDPIDERLAPAVEEYIDKWNDPLTWETFERDFTPAREAQMAQVARENARRIQVAEDHLKTDLSMRGDGTSSWYPSWIPLAFAETPEDSLFKNILGLDGPLFDAGPRSGERMSLREFFELDGSEPAGLTNNGSQRYIACDDFRRRCRKEFYANFRELVELHDGSQISATAPRIISFTIRARSSETTVFSPLITDRSFVAELNEEGTTRIRETEEVEEIQFADFDWESIRLLQPAAMNPDEYVIDTPLYWQPAAKPVSPTEASSWGRIKATFVD